MSSSGNPVIGYQYTFQGASKTYLNRRDAIKEQIRNGGGTIKTLYAPPTT